MSPSNPDLIAFYSGGNLWIHNCATNQDIQLTNLSSEDVEIRGIVAGHPSYITQEEFNRYSGFWWCPTPDPDEPKNAHFILYEEVDASQVDIVALKAQEDVLERQRFPRAGGVNTRSNLKIIQFNSSSLEVRIHGFDIYQYFPWCEYVVRMDWTPDGEK